MSAASRPEGRDTILWDVLLPTAYVAFLLIFAGLLFNANRPLTAAVQVQGLGNSSSVTHALLSGSSTPYQAAPLGASFGGLAAFDLALVGLTAVASFALAFYLLGGHRLKLWMPLSAALLYGGVAVGVLSLGFLGLATALLVPSALWALYLLTALGRAPSFLAMPFGSFLTVGLGVSMSIYLPPTALVFLPVGYVAWDIYAVLKGQLPEVVAALPGNLEGMFLVSVGGTEIGFGDLFFYSLVTCTGLLFSTADGLLVASAAVVGFFATLILLHAGRRGTLPALPLPVLLSLCSLLAAIYL